MKYVVRYFDRLYDCYNEQLADEVEIGGDKLFYKMFGSKYCVKLVDVIKIIPKEATK